MTRQRTPRLPFSPAELAGLATRPLPPAALGPALALTLRLIQRRHPGLFERLSGLGAPAYLVDAVELPFVFHLVCDPARPRLRALSRGQAAKAKVDASIRGPLKALIDLLEGRLDGDALFFSRELSVEGDTEAVVALRNAVDDAEIDLVGDVLSLLGPLAGPARRAFDGAEALAARAAKDLAGLADAVLGPAPRRTPGPLDRPSSPTAGRRARHHRRGRTPRPHAPAPSP